MDMENPDSPNSISSDQLTVDMLSPRTKRRRQDDDRRDLVQTPEVKNNNNDVGFVLMDEEPHENGDDDTDVCYSWSYILINIMFVVRKFIIINTNLLLIRKVNTSTLNIS